MTAAFVLSSTALWDGLWAPYSSSYLGCTTKNIYSKAEPVIWLGLLFFLEKEKSAKFSTRNVLPSKQLTARQVRSTFYVPVLSEFPHGCPAEEPVRQILIIAISTLQVRKLKGSVKSSI